MSREAIEAYLEGLNGSAGELDELMRKILAEPGGVARARRWVARGLRGCGEAGLPGVDRDGAEVALVAREMGGGMRVVLIRPDGSEHVLDDRLWAAVMNWQWERVDERG